ncbi:MAG: FecR family protein [Dehalococcoidia bacterium]
MKWTHSDRISSLDQAIGQFLSLGSATADATSEAEVSRWRDSDPENARSLDDVSKAWNALGLLEHSPPVVETIERYQSRRLGAARRWFPMPLRVAASILLVVGLLVLAPWRMHPPTVYQTAAAEQSVAILTDGSTVHLNSRSEVQVSYSDTARSVVLVDGEANFRVEHDPNRPFVVVSNDVAVRAIGTEFDVRREGSRITISVLDGTVEVVDVANDSARSNEAHAWRQELRRGRALIVDRSTSAVTVELTTSDLSRIQGWQAGRLSFKNEPLQSVVDAVNRNITDGPIVIADDALRNVSVSMNFDITEARNFIPALLLGFPIDAEYLPSGEIRLHLKDPAHPST